MGKAVDLTLIESELIGTIGVGESTIPPLVTYNRLLGINEADFMRATQATFKLGIGFENWKEVGHRYFHSFGVTGKDHWSAGFQHFWLNGLERGHHELYDDYCLELSAAYAGKFAHLPEDRMNYAYQLDSSLYAKFLRAMAEDGRCGPGRGQDRRGRARRDQRRDRRAEARIRAARRRGFVRRLHRLSRPADRLARSKSGFEDWTHWLPCDSAIAIQTRAVRPPVPYTLAMAHDSGWQWRIPLQHRVGNGIVFCSRYLDKDAALERLLGNIEGDTLTEPNVLRFKAGVRHRQWVKNCIAVGLSSGFMEPLESTSIHLIQRAVLRLIRMLPLNEVSERDVLEFNDQMLTDYLQIRDFLVLHYKATDRRDSEFWRYCAEHGDPRQPDPEDRAVPRDGPGVPTQRGIVRREQLGPGDDGARHRAEILSPDRGQAERRGDDQAALDPPRQCRADGCGAARP